MATRALLGDTSSMMMPSPGGHNTRDMFLATSGYDFSSLDREMVKQATAMTMHTEKSLQSVLTTVCAHSAAIQGLRFDMERNMQLFREQLDGVVEKVKDLENRKAVQLEARVVLLEERLLAAEHALEDKPNKAEVWIGFQRVDNDGKVLREEVTRSFQEALAVESAAREFAIKTILDDLQSQGHLSSSVLKGLEERVSTMGQEVQRLELRDSEDRTTLSGIVYRIDSLEKKTDEKDQTLEHMKKLQDNLQLDNRAGIRRVDEAEANLRAAESKITEAVSRAEVASRAVCDKPDRASFEKLRKEVEEASKALENKMSVIYSRLSGYQQAVYDVQKTVTTKADNQTLQEKLDRGEHEAALQEVVNHVQQLGADRNDAKLKALFKDLDKIVKQLCDKADKSDLHDVSKQLTLVPELQKSVRSAVALLQDKLNRKEAVQIASNKAEKHDVDQLKGRVTEILDRLHRHVHKKRSAPGQTEAEKEKEERRDEERRDRERKELERERVRDGGSTSPAFSKRAEQAAAQDCTRCLTCFQPVDPSAALEFLGQGIRPNTAPAYGGGFRMRTKDPLQLPSLSTPPPMEPPRGGGNRKTNGLAVLREGSFSP